MIIFALLIIACICTPSHYDLIPTMILILFLWNVKLLKKYSFIYCTAFFAGSMAIFFIPIIAIIIEIITTTIELWVIWKVFISNDDDDGSKKLTKEAEEKENSWRHRVLKPIFVGVDSK